jgi:hypothetical protein
LEFLTISLCHRRLAAGRNMHRLPRLHGAALKSSNETILADFGNLAKFVVGKRARACQLSRDQTEDLLHSILVELFKAPVVYRNYKGVSLMLKHKMRDVLAKTLKSEVEIAVGLPGQSKSKLEGDPFAAAFAELSTQPASTDGIDCELILKRMDVLTSSERTVLSLLYGLDGCGVFPVAAIAKRLGKDEWWVHRKRERAISRLRSVLRIKISRRPQNAARVRRIRPVLPPAARSFG